MTVPTREVTIYRRSESGDDLATFFERLAEDFMEKTIRNDIVDLDLPGASGVMIIWRYGPEPATWFDAATRLAGPLPADYETQDCGALLWVEVDGVTYVIGFGSGFRAVPDDFKDHGFGLGFTIRAVDADIRGIVRRSMTGLGRQDATRVPGGIPIGHVGLSEYAELVRSLAGRVDPADLGLDGDKPVRVEGAAGLRMAIPLAPDLLVALLRRISEICARDVRDEFAFIEAIVPVRDKARSKELDEQLNAYLRNDLDADDTVTQLAPAVPLEVTEAAGEAQSLVIKVGRRELLRRTSEPDLEMLLTQWRGGREIPPIEALRRGEVRLCEDEHGQHAIAKASADRWLAVSTRLDTRDYFLIEGSWYEGGVRYHDSIQRQIAGLFADTPGVPLPKWPEGDEENYNKHVEKLLGPERVLKLDRVMVPSPYHGKKGFEACDLLGPDNELIHVKAGQGTGPFSHLFNQALISTEALCLLPDAREEFAGLVRRTSNQARTLPKGWRPEKVVFGMMVKRKTPLTADTLFPHAQIALARMSSILKANYGVEVEVIPIAREAD
ncbi:DUF6119 family protein [Actinomadura bangladeshensis]|uniref:TIGR04141 family sporadically distributed protein n=1 Tax=Actinomadura bangladeshensis TaxID=453573 RepID=A0A4R4PEY4_9ACTN|nr:DUF6119 family protein [Actinomadura bangladeshensis]TDC20052.1 hypothetical protein E1284_01490 [Actinomadura bangladeshensis]